mgnify:CR=1 FL=1
MVIDKEAWKNTTKDLNYSPEEKKVEETKQVSKSPSAAPDLSGFKYLAYAVIGIIIVGLLILIIKNIRPVTEVAQVRVEATSLEDAEENLPMVALTKIYQEALDLFDYKSALRIKFLMVLQTMIDAEMIIWKKRKTNENYLLELSDGTILAHFKTAVNTFDDVWYGEAAVTETQYVGIAESLDQLKNKISGGQE